MTAAPPNTVLVLAPLGISSQEMLARITNIAGTGPEGWHVVVPSGRPTLIAAAHGAAITCVRQPKGFRGLWDLAKTAAALRRSTRDGSRQAFLVEDLGWLGSYQSILHAGAWALGAKKLTTLSHSGESHVRHGPPQVRAPVRAAINNIDAYRHLVMLPARIAELPVPKYASNTPRRAAYIRADLGVALRDEPGGSRTHTRGMVGGLQQVGMDLITATCWPVTPPGLIRPHHIEVRPVPPTDIHPELSMLAYDRLCSAPILEGVPGPIDFVYQRYALFSTTGLQLAAKHGVPLVLEVNASEVRFRQEYDTITFLKASMEFERALFEAASLVVVVSDRVSDEVNEIAPAARILVLPNAVNPNEFQVDEVERVHTRHRLGLLEADIVVGFFGRFYEWHGLDVLTEAAIRLLPEITSLHFLFVGEGSRREMAQTALAPWGERAIFTGMVSHEEVPALMSACDILAAPHAAKEGFVGSPTKVFEYLAAGRAIVASRLEQMSQVLEDEKTAILTTPSDVGELTNALRRLANDSQTRASLGNSARASAVRSHTWAHRAERLVADLSSGGR